MFLSKRKKKQKGETPDESYIVPSSEQETMPPPVSRSAFSSDLLNSQYSSNFSVDDEIESSSSDSSKTPYDNLVRALHRITVDKPPAKKPSPFVVPWKANKVDAKIAAENGAIPPAPNHFLLSSKRPLIIAVVFLCVVFLVSAVTTSAFTAEEQARVALDLSTLSPTLEPTPLPTETPTAQPTYHPTTGTPTRNPTTMSPTERPTTSPTSYPTTPAPTSFPTTPEPTSFPTASPTAYPTSRPTTNPTPFPTASV